MVEIKEVLGRDPAQGKYSSAERRILRRVAANPTTDAKRRLEQVVNTAIPRNGHIDGKTSREATCHRASPRVFCRS